MCFGREKIKFFKLFKTKDLVSNSHSYNFQVNQINILAVGQIIWFFGSGKALRDHFTTHRKHLILGDPGAACRDEGIFVGESLLQQGDEPLGTYSYRTSSRSISISRF